MNADDLDAILRLQDKVIKLHAALAVVLDLIERTGDVRPTVGQTVAAFPEHVIKFARDALAECGPNPSNP